MRTAQAGRHDDVPHVPGRPVENALGQRGPGVVPLCHESVTRMMRPVVLQTRIVSTNTSKIPYRPASPDDGCAPTVCDPFAGTMMASPIGNRSPLDSGSVGSMQITQTALCDLPTSDLMRLQRSVSTQMSWGSTVPATKGPQAQ
jgi:hypothetical protein